jgi:hypothetical protein
MLATEQALARDERGVVTEGASAVAGLVGLGSFARRARDDAARRGDRPRFRLEVDRM